MGYSCVHTGAQALYVRTMFRRVIEIDVIYVNISLCPLIPPNVIYIDFVINLKLYQVFYIIVVIISLSVFSVLQHSVFWVKLERDDNYDLYNYYNYISSILIYYNYYTR